MSIFGCECSGESPAIDVTLRARAKEGRFWRSLMPLGDEGVDCAVYPKIMMNYFLE